jgi:hypothetical protein
MGQDVQRPKIKKARNSAWQDMPGIGFNGPAGDDSFLMKNSH